MAFAASPVEAPRHHSRPMPATKKFGCCISPWFPSSPFCLDAVIADGRWVVGDGREGGRPPCRKTPPHNPHSQAKDSSTIPSSSFFRREKIPCEPFLLSLSVGTRKFEIICIERPSRGGEGERNVMSAEKHPPETRLLQPLAQVCKNVRCLQKEKEKSTLFPLLLLGENSF